MKSIAIIGGGFSGTITAINLARLSTTPLRISVLDKSPVPCRGIAYSTRNAGHLLNVVARNMSALADQPNHFVEWLGTRSEYLDEVPSALREKFVPRRVYGDYLQSLFQWYAKSFTGENQTSLQFVQDEAKDIFLEEQRAHVALVSGGMMTADKIVLAVGNQTPAPLRLRGLDLNSPKYIANPWIGWEKKLPSNDRDVLLIGTGLTMVDTFITLRGLGWRGTIYAVSRHGLLPLSHFKGFEYPDLLDDGSLPIPLRKAYSTFMRHYRSTTARNLNPAILVDKLRPLTQRLWQGFSPFEKRQFDRHCRPRWNVVRHRIAPEIHQQLREAMTSQQLRIIKARLCECEETNDKMKIWIESHGAKQAIEAAAVVNCTGPRERYVPSESDLFNNLASRGLIEPDQMNMGIKVAPGFTVVDRHGYPSKILFALGALLKGTLWESVAVPELRSQAFRLAEHIVGHLADDTAEKSAIAEVMEDVIEYSI